MFPPLKLDYVAAGKKQISLKETFSPAQACTNLTKKMSSVDTVLIIFSTLCWVASNALSLRTLEVFLEKNCKCSDCLAVSM